MLTQRLPVAIRSQDGRAGGMGHVEIARPPFRRRLARAGALLLTGLVTGVVFLPVPLMHFFGVGFFLVMCWLAARRLGSKVVLKAASGRCPACQQDGVYFVGFGGKRLAFPIATSCPGCHIGLELEPAGVPA